jgi:hypothetical protein
VRNQNVVELFDKEFGPKLHARASGFRYMIEHLEQAPHVTPVIIETGTARQKGNWGGDGQSTLIWDFWLKYRSGRGISVDISEEACHAAVNQVDHVFVYCTDSVRFLGLKETVNYAQACYLLYLDSFDLDISDPIPSALHHLMELTAVWADLPSGCLIVVDDCHSKEVGKHIFVEKFMEHLGIEPALTGYQRGWLKP